MNHRKAIILFTLFFISFLSTNAQQWCDKGAKWYSHYGWFATYGYREYTYTHDTTIAGQQCSIISTHTKYVDQSIPKLFYGPVTETYSYANNGIVYQYDTSGRWDTLYNFHLLPGDSTPFFHYGSCSKMVHIKDTGHVILNGYNLQWYSFTYYNPNQFGNKIQLDTVFERIGYIGPMSLLEPCFVTDCPEGGLCNYYDSAFGNLYNNASTCLFIPNGIEDINTTQFSVFPNPSCGVVNINYPNYYIKSASVRIYNCVGQLLQTEAISTQNVLDFSQQPKGIYFVNMGNEMKKIVIE